MSGRSPAFYFSSRLSSLVFGPRLVSGKAFSVGFALSVLIAAIAYLIAVATTPISRLELAPNIVATPLRLLADIQFSYATSAPLRFWSWAAGIALALAWLSFEFLFVIKSRWLLRLVRETTPLLGLAAIYLVDVATSGLMLMIFAPVFIIIFGKIYLLFAGTLLNTDSMIALGISSAELLPRDHVWAAYKFLCGAISQDIGRRLQGDFDSYYVAAVGALTDTGCRISDGSHLLGCHSIPMLRPNMAIGFNESVQFYTTTMLVSAFATTIWMTLSTVALLLLKIYRTPAKVLSWLHRKPARIMTRIIVPTAIITIVGSIAIPFLSPLLWSTPPQVVSTPIQIDLSPK